MTCRMAAGQQKERLTSSNLLEHHRGKKKRKLESSDYVLYLRSHIYLEWDDTQKRVVAKKEQVGMAWTDMAPFVDFACLPHSGLADILSVPQEIFGMENLTEVLSYEVWATCLSESERKLLTQFLPSGTGAEQVVHSLFKGENHHFGNPYLKWSASLCSGNLHPDVVLCTERQRRANTKAYNSEINKYHTGMLEVLNKWKERWIICKDPEKFWSEGFAMHKQENLHFSPERVKAPSISKKETPHKICICHGDVAKYMSYIKISKKQHELIKNIKHSGDGIQSKSLSRVLSDIKGFHVHPYGSFEEEEMNRLHDHWLRVATRDLPVFFEEHRDKKLKREQWAKSLAQDLAEKKKQIVDKDEELKCLENSPQEHVDGDSEHPTIDMLDQVAVDSTYDSTSDHHAERIPSFNSHQENEDLKCLENSPQEHVDGDSEHPTTDMLDQVAVDFTYGSTCDHHEERIPSFYSHQEVSPILLDKEAVDQDLLKPADNSPHTRLFFGKPVPAVNVMEPNVTISSAKDMWQAVSIQDSYYQTTSESRRYMPDDGLSLRQPQHTEELLVHVIDLESDESEQEAEDSVASALHMDSRAPSFYSYSNQDQNELLPHFPKGLGTLSPYAHEHMNRLKQPELLFSTVNDCLPESVHLSHQFQEQRQLIEQGRVRERELDMHQVENNMYSHGRGHFLLAEQLGLAALQSPVNGGFEGHNWFPDEHRANNGWSGVELASRRDQCFSNGGNADSSLYGGLSHCSMRPSHSPYDSPSSEQFIQAGNYIGGGIPNNHDIFGYAPHQLKNPSGLDAAAAAAPSLTSASWMNFLHQNPGLPDSMGRTFLRSWNR